MNQTASRSGFFGKLSSHGDFVSRRLSPTFLRLWDDWLQAGIKSSQDRLGEGWRDVYLNSPVWHFALAAQVCGEPGWAGVMMPSEDRVGRYFPLTLAYGGADVPVIDRMYTDVPWYADLEALALSSLRQGFSLERFDRALSNLRPPSRAVSLLPSASRRRISDNPVWLHPVAQASMAQAVAQWRTGLEEMIGEHSLEGHSLFWTQGTSRLPATLLLCQGLPTVPLFLEMLSGRDTQVLGAEHAHTRSVIRI